MNKSDMATKYNNLKVKLESEKNENSKLIGKLESLRTQLNDLIGVVDINDAEKKLIELEENIQELENNIEENVIKLDELLYDNE